MEVSVCFRLYIIRDALWNCSTHCSSILSLWRRWDMQLLHFLKKLVRNKLSGMGLKNLNNDMNFLPALIFCNISQENASYISMADRNTEVHNEPWKIQSMSHGRHSEQLVETVEENHLIHHWFHRQVPLLRTSDNPGIMKLLNLNSSCNKNERLLTTYDIY